MQISITIPHVGIKSSKVSEIKSDRNLKDKSPYQVEKPKGDELYFDA